MKWIEENLQKAKDILVEYQNTTEVSAILQLYKKLSLYSVFLWENLSSLKKQYNISNYTRKIEVSKSYLNNKAQKITDRTSLEMANTENEELFNQEQEMESLALRLDVFLKQVNRVLQVMSSDISYLKQESNRTNRWDII